MLERFRQFWTNVWSPIGDLLLRLGVSPNTVTVVGTLGVCAGALVFFPQGWLFAGVLVITAFVFSDMIDGYMARTSGQISPFGAFLDSTLDRIGDAAIFGGLAMYYVGPGDNGWVAALAIYCLSMGSVTSYARARAESLGMQAKVGIAERSDRLVLILAVDRAGRPVPSARRRRPGDVADPDRSRPAGRGQHDHGRAADPRRTPAGPRPAAPHRIGATHPAALESGHG